MLECMHLLRFIFPIEVCCVIVDYNNQIRKRQQIAASTVVRNLFLDSQTDKYGKKDTKRLSTINQLCKDHGLTKYTLDRKDLIQYREYGTVTKSLFLSVHFNSNKNVWLKDLKEVGVSIDVFSNPRLFIQDYVLEDMMYDQEILPFSL